MKKTDLPPCPFGDAPDTPCLAKECIVGSTECPKVIFDYCATHSSSVCQLVKKAPNLNYTSVFNQTDFYFRQNNCPFHSTEKTPPCDCQDINSPDCLVSIFDFCETEYRINPLCMEIAQHMPFSVDVTDCIEKEDFKCVRDKVSQYCSEVDCYAKPDNECPFYIAGDTGYSPCNEPSCVESEGNSPICIMKVVEYCHDFESKFPEACSKFYEKVNVLTGCSDKVCLLPSMKDFCSVHNCDISSCPLKVLDRDAPCFDPVCGEEDLDISIPLFETNHFRCNKRMMEFCHDRYFDFPQCRQAYENVNNEIGHVCPETNVDFDCLITFLTPPPTTPPPPKCFLNEPPSLFMNNDKHPCHPLSPCSKLEKEDCARNIIDYCLTSNAPTCKTILDTVHTKFLTRTSCPFAPAYSPCSPMDKTLTCKNSFGFEPKCFISLVNFCNEPIGTTVPVTTAVPTTVPPTTPKLGPTTKKGAFTTIPTTTTTMPTINPNTKGLYCNSIVNTVNDYTKTLDASNGFSQYNSASHSEASFSLVITFLIIFLFL